MITESCVEQEPEYARYAVKMSKPKYLQNMSNFACKEFAKFKIKAL